MTTETAMPPARRGDLVVIERAERDYINGRGEQLRFDVMVVTGVFRDGRVKTARHVNADYAQQIDRLFGFRRSYLIPATGVDKAAVIEAVKGHHWPDHPGQLKSFDSLDEVRALVGPHLHSAAA